jgi:uncharacterized membrane protein
MSGKKRQPTRVRSYFLTGLVICAPLAITAYLTWTVVVWIDSWIIPYIPARYNPDTYLPFSVPGFGLVLGLIAITIIGFLTANLIGKSIVSYGERMLGRMPLVRNLYNGLKQIFQTVLSDKNDSFTQVGLIEYPRKELWAIVFIATDTKGEVQSQLDDKEVEQTISVFLPTTPNPTSGFLLFVPKSDVILLNMSVEEAAKLVISAGLVTPEQMRKEQKLAIIEKNHQKDRDE